MSIKTKLGNRLAKIRRKAKRIFTVGFEDMVTQIYYGPQEAFRLVVVRNNDHLLYEKEITRSQAFRLMNTR